MSGQHHVADSPARALIRHLAEVRAEPDGVLSVYIDLDPSVVPTRHARETEIRSLVQEAEETFVRRDLDHDERQARISAVDRVRQMLSARELAKDRTRSLAVFAAPTAGVFDVLRLPYPVAPVVVVDAAPWLRPVAGEPGPRTWAVLLVDRRRSRLFFGGERRLIEVDSFEDNVPGHQKQGGWSAERYQRHSDEAAEEHITKAARKLFEFFERTLFDGLLIGAPDPAYGEAVACLHPYVRERLHGRVRIEIPFPTPAQVLDEARPLFAEAHEKAIADLVSTIEEAPRERVALGPQRVFDALFERRIDTLVIEERFGMEGVRCPECDWLGVDGSVCPFDGASTVRRDDVVDDAVDLALTQAARVVSIDEDGDAHASEPIAALLRY